MLSLLTLRILSVRQSVRAVLEKASQSCNQWTQLSESIEQRVAGLHDSVEVLRVTALAQKQKGEASKPALVVLERTIADLQAQLGGEKKSHQLTQVLCPSTTRIECQSVHLWHMRGLWGSGGGVRDLALQVDVEAGYLRRVEPTWGRASLHSLVTRILACTRPYTMNRTATTVCVGCHFWSWILSGPKTSEDFNSAKNSSIASCLSLLQ